MLWVKTKSKAKQLCYALKNGEHSLIEMQINQSKGEVEIQIPLLKSEFSFKKQNAWNTNLDIFKDGNLIGNTKSEKLYSNKFVLTLNGYEYNYFYRNNPLAELLIYDAKREEDLLSCGLFVKPGGVVETEFRMYDAGNKCKDIMLIQAIVWYLFYPVALENTSSDSILLLMLGGM